MSSLTNPFLIKSYSDDSGNWYRVYSDGWIEQGGIYTSDQGKRIINLLLPFKDTLYDAIITPTVSAPVSFGFYTSGAGNPSKTPTHFYLTCGAGGVIGWNWFACGYGV